MSLRNSLLVTVATLGTAAALAGAAAADGGLPTPPGGAPTLSSVEPSATLLLPRPVRPGTTAAIVLRLDPASAPELRAKGTACVVQLGATRITGTTRISGADARCAVRIPRSAAGKTIRGAMRVVLTHVAIERQFALKVARG